MVRKSALSWFRRVFQAAGHEIILVDFNQDFFLNNYLFIWLHWVFLAACGLSRAAVSRALLSSWGVRASYWGGFSCYGAQSLGTWASIVA